MSIFNLRSNIESKKTKNILPNDVTRHLMKSENKNKSFDLHLIKRDNKAIGFKFKSVRTQVQIRSIAKYHFS